MKSLDNNERMDTFKTATNNEYSAVIYSPSFVPQLDVFLLCVCVCVFPYNKNQWGPVLFCIDMRESKLLHDSSPVNFSQKIW